MLNSKMGKISVKIYPFSKEFSFVYLPVPSCQIQLVTPRRSDVDRKLITSRGFQSFGLYGNATIGLKFTVLDAKKKR